MAKESFPLVQVKNPYNMSSSDWTNANQTYPAQGHMEWKQVGDVNIQGKTWSGDTTISASGDPTSSSRASLGINTGANHDANVLWSCSPSKATERQVRGVYFRTYTNQTKFRPRISSVALQYTASNNAISYVGLNYRDANYTHSSGGSLNYEGGDTSHYWWGVGNCSMPDGDPYHQDKRLTGVLFHMETTWKSGSAVDNWCYVSNLRFICDAKRDSTPYYNNHYRMWGLKVQ